MNNPDPTLIYLSFGLYLAAVLLIGVLGYRRTIDIADYLLAGRRLGRWVTALSAGASDMSGWLLLGLPGYAYMTGLEAGWMALGLLLGTYLNWKLIARRLRVASQAAANALTLPRFFEHRSGDHSHAVRLICAIMILVFFLFYTSAGLVASGKLFESVFGLPYFWAVVSGTLAVLAYTAFGGFIAVAWTDLLQGLLMLIALLAVALISWHMIDGWQAMHAQLQDANPALTDIWRDNQGEALGTIGILSLLGWGLGYFGQPHILVRFMAIRSDTLVGSARRIAITWTFLCMAAALIIGWSGHGLLGHDLSAADSEKVFIYLVELLFHPLIAGLCLAAILAAIMSTIDSQLLVASSALTEDLYRLLPHGRQLSAPQLMWIGRGSVCVIALIALWLALSPDSQVLDLVAYAWAGFGAAFGPTLLMALYAKRFNADTAIAGILTGGVTVMIWRPLEGGWFDLYELVPGFILSLLACLLINSVNSFTRSRRSMQ